MDFVHKLKIADKESEETKYWLILIKDNFDFPEAELLMEELMTIKRILGKIISSSKK
jgi:four helix bundle protein